MLLAAVGVRVSCRGLMVVQIALSLVLLVSTGLFMRTLNNLRTWMPGSTVTAWCSSASTRRLPATPAIGSRHCRRACGRASKGCPGCARPRSRVRRCYRVFARTSGYRFQAIHLRPRRCRSSTPTGSRRTSSGRWSCRWSSGGTSRNRTTGWRRRWRSSIRRSCGCISTVRIPSGSPSSSLATPTASRSSE